MTVGDKVYAEYGRTVEGTRREDGDRVTLAIEGRISLHSVTVGRGYDGVTDLGAFSSDSFVHLDSPTAAAEKRAMAKAVRDMHKYLDEVRDMMFRKFRGEHEISSPPADFQAWMPDSLCEPWDELIRKPEGAESPSVE